MSIETDRPGKKVIREEQSYAKPIVSVVHIPPLFRETQIFVVSNRLE